jgi:hypothetical protein
MNSNARARKHLDTVASLPRGMLGCGRPLHSREGDVAGSIGPL